MDVIVKDTAIAAAQSHFLAAVHDHHRIAIGFSSHFLYMFQIHDEGTMYAEETPRVQSFLQASHSFPKQMVLGRRAKPDIIAFGADPANV